MLKILVDQLPRAKREASKYGVVKQLPRPKRKTEKESGQPISSIEKGFKSQNGPPITSSEREAKKVSLVNFFTRANCEAEKESITISYLERGKRPY